MVVLMTGAAHCATLEGVGVRWPDELRSRAFLARVAEQGGAIVAKTETKNVTDQWTWFSDYVAGIGSWTVNCPENRQCEVGMGVKLFGAPRGERIPFHGCKEFTTLGLGAIHVRVTDGRGVCPVRLDEGHIGTIKIIDTSFP